MEIRVGSPKLAASATGCREPPQYRVRSVRSIWTITPSWMLIVTCPNRKPRSAA
jgi:hypothetical protein